MARKKFLETVRPRLHNLSKAKHVDYHEHLCTLMEEAGLASQTDVNMMLEQYRAAINKQYKSIVYQRELEGTPSVTEALENCNNRYRYIIGSLANSQNISSSESEERANLLREQILKRYTMRLCQAAIPERMEKFEGLIINLREEWQDILDVLNLDGELTLLKNYIEEYYKAYNLRIDEMTNRPKAVSENLRHEMDELNHILLLYITAWANTTSSDAKRKKFYTSMGKLLKQCNEVAGDMK